MFWLPGAIIRRVQIVETVFRFRASQGVQGQAATRIPIGLVGEQVEYVNAPVSPTMWCGISLASNILIRNWRETPSIRAAATVVN